MAEAETEHYTLAKDNTDLAHIPGSFGPPIIGHTIALVRDLHGTISKQQQQYGAVSRFGLAGFKGVLLLGPDLSQEVLRDPQRNFSAEMGYRRSLGRYYLGSLLLRDGEEHRFQRRMMQTAFKAEAMRGYAERMGAMMASAIDGWRYTPEMKGFPAIKDILLDSAAQIFVGVDPGEAAAKNMNRAFTDVANGMLGIILKELPGTRHAKAKKQERFLQSFFNHLIDERRQGSASDVFSYLCLERTEDGAFFAKADISVQMSFLLFAAHDTTTSALSHLLYYLGQDMETQQRLRDEVMALDKPLLEYSDLEKMPLAEVALKEALRLHPSVMMMQRRSIKACELGGYHIPENTLIFLAPQHTHRMADYWDAPDKFDLDRWLAPREEHKRHSFSFVGFGGGVHKCIGMHFALMQSKIFLHQFLRRYRFKLANNFSSKMQTVPLPKPVDNLPMVLAPIKAV